MAATYLLVSHGSRHRESQIALERLAQLVCQQLQPDSPLVGTAALECTPLPLHQQIQEFASQVAAVGGNRLPILPLFLSAGIHVREDIPREVALAQQALGSTISLELQPYLGSEGRLLPLLSRQFAQLPAAELLLLSHGSRYPGANAKIEKLACQLGAVAAYWSVPPSLAEQIAVFASKGVKNIAISPYFLFSGGIVPAIACQVQELQAAFPSLQLHLGEPLAATPELAQFIVEGVAR